MRGIPSGLPQRESTQRMRDGFVRAAQLIIGCVTLGAGVSLLLTATQGSDGYSTLISGL